MLISGAGIAGPALAHWLHRYGFAVTVVERAPELRTGGYKVDIRGAAIEVAERMGILQDIHRASTDMRTGAYVNGDGTRIATLPAEILGARTGRDDEIMRGELARIHSERTRGDVEYVFGDSVTSISPTPTASSATTAGPTTTSSPTASSKLDSVEVTFERSSPRRFDIVVGADGVHSTVRRLAFGPEERFVRHLGGYISAFSLPNDLDLDREELYHALPGKLVCVYHSAGAPAAKGLMTFRAPRLTYDHRDAMQQLSLLGAAFMGHDTGTPPTGCWSEIPRMLEAAREAPDFYFDGLNLIEMDRWSSGRVVLLGDAAHCPSPASGQGTGMALVGAYVLAGELAAAGGDTARAFGRYEEEMRGYVTVNHRLTEKFAKEMTAGSWPAIRFRHLMMRILPYMPWKNLVAKKIAEGVQRAANAIALKVYPVPTAPPTVAPAPPLAAAPSITATRSTT
ncbi:FAD-dependent monooxygenase [Streptomyces halobius]|uniref:FAD-dependent monooxygenase n=1 Tax=Streptomyces halobius TaxID=2879846 RepID=UPI00200F011E|nr:FAD-dependent monooxygenase [Streptomyces halobius]